MLKTINGGRPPTKGSKYSACVDLYANEHVMIRPQETVKIKLGVCIDINQSYLVDYLRLKSLEVVAPEAIPDFIEAFMGSHYMQLEPRSSVRANGLISGTGIIDLDFKDEIQLILTNVSNNPQQILKGSKIAQVTILEHKVSLFGIESEEERTGGFGRTD